HHGPQLVLVAGVDRLIGVHIGHHVVDGGFHQLQRTQGLAPGVEAGHQSQHQEDGKAGRELHYLISSGLSAAGLSLSPPARPKSTWPIRFSRTMAEDVSHTRSPSCSISVSLPVCRPIYCSPKSPEVRSEERRVGQ